MTRSMKRDYDFSKNEELGAIKKPSDDVKRYMDCNRPTFSNLPCLHHSFSDSALAIAPPSVTSIPRNCLAACTSSLDALDLMQDHWGDNLNHSGNNIAKSLLVVNARFAVINNFADGSWTRLLFDCNTQFL